MTGETVYVGNSPVHNVLVHVGEADDAAEKTAYVGPVAHYTLYFPETYTGSLDGKTVTVRGIACDVIGHPDHERPRHVFGRWLGKWDMVARVKKTQAAMAEAITVFAVTVSRDTLGNRTETRTTLYNGVSQMRWVSGGESDKTGGTEAYSAFYAVLPWKPAFANWQTQPLFITYGGKTYNVESVENVDEKSQTASMRAVWHG